VVRTILVFPSNLDISVRFAAEARSWGWKVVGASSVADDSCAERYDQWVQVPYINDPLFFLALRSVAERFQIEAIHTAHAPTHLLLQTQLSRHLPKLRLFGDSPYQRQMRWVEYAFTHAADKLSCISEIKGQPTLIDPDWVAALLARADGIYGECSADKIVALCRIFPSAPRGDVIEIGSFFGKSAYVLNRLAHRYGIGLTVAIDPWDMGLSVQRESPEIIQALSAVWNWDRVFDGFLLTMQACSIPPFNYLKVRSADAWTRYREGAIIKTPEFGETAVAGSIAVLHIDGNHDEVAVAEDFALWGQRLAHGGWIVFDDYEWSQGDGPRRVGDRAISVYGDRLIRQFVAGGALFLKVR
jgi:hypothetical protein